MRPEIKSCFYGMVLSGLLATFSAAARESLTLDSSWQFKQGEVSGAQNPELNAADWQSISIPHCWGWQAAQAGKDYYRGPGWYRRELDVSPEIGKRFFLRFEAASLVAQVYLNSKLLGEHRGGFGAFCFEITTNLSASGKNLLAVRVSNEKFSDVAPLSGGFGMYGGLYRPVHLITTTAVCFTPADHASPGAAWLQTSVSATQAVLDVTAEISNSTTNGRPFALYLGKKAAGGHFTLVAKVLDADGQPIASTEEPIILAQRVTEPFNLRVVMANPHLWDGRKDPYLYRAVVELRSADGIVDAVEQPLGLRFFHVDPELGFFLNGRPYHLHGVAKHQDRWDKGWAVSEADLDEDMALIKEIGATVVRCAYYQHSDYFYSLCDHAGILVWAELPQVDQVGKTPEFAETARNQLLDLIRQNISHPSIFTWSLYNEVRPGSADPHRELNNLAHGEDPTRPTIGATSHATWPQMNKITDILGWNTYPGWYNPFGELSDTAFWQDYRASSRNGGVCISEYGAGANPDQHEENPRQPDPESQWHPEEWQCIVHEAAWKQFKSNPFIWGTFVWNMFDFTVPNWHQGGNPGRNDKGLVTFDRKLKKDAFYFYKANWSDEPVLYIAGRRFIEHTNAVTDVKIYSNAAKVQLSLNGIPQGGQGDGTNGVFLWRNIRLQPGENRVEARAVKDGRDLQDACAWAFRLKKS